MNKKAAIILLSASLAFLVASAILISPQIRTPTAIGDSQLKLFNLQKTEDSYMLYLDIAAKFALAETMKMTDSGQEIYALCIAKQRACEELPQYFKTAFGKHVEAFNKAYKQNLNVDNYEFKSKITALEDGKPAIEFLGISKDNIIVKKEQDLTYTIKPNFKIKAGLEELNKLAITPEIMAINYFNNVVDKFQRCIEKTKDQKISCFCENSEISPTMLPEGYEISIITTTKKENLLGGAEYQFKLYKGESIVIREGRQKVRTLKGIFGAYELLEKDLENKLCYPGAFSVEQGYLIGKNSEKGKLHFYTGDANCKGVSTFSMVEFVKESDFGRLKSPECSEIGVKS